MSSQISPSSSEIRRGDDQPVARRARRKQALDLLAAEHSLAPPHRSRALVRFELVNRIDRDSSVPAGAADDAVQRRERAGRGPSASSPLCAARPQRSDVIDRQRAHSPAREGRQQVTLEVVAVRLERAGVSLADGDLGLEARDPPARGRVEPKPEASANAAAHRSPQRLSAPRARSARVRDRTRPRGSTACPRGERRPRTCRWAACRCRARPKPGADGWRKPLADLLRIRRPGR